MGGVRAFGTINMDRVRLIVVVALDGLFKDELVGWILIEWIRSGGLDWLDLYLEFYTSSILKNPIS